MSFQLHKLVLGSFTASYPFFNAGLSALNLRPGRNTNRNKFRRRPPAAGSHLLVDRLTASRPAPRGQLIHHDVERLVGHELREHKVNINVYFVLDRLQLRLQVLSFHR